MHGHLLVLTLALFLVQGLAPDAPAQHVVVTALAGATLVVAFRFARARPALNRAVTALALAAFAAALVSELAGGSDGATERLMNALLTALGPPAVAIGVFRDMRFGGRIMVSAVSGVLALYLLIGMCFGFIYGAFDRLGDGTFFADGSPATIARCQYFSFVTLTTVGYGDLVARAQAGQTLSALEALVGQIYLVTIVALIVGNLGRPTGGRR